MGSPQAWRSAAGRGVLLLGATGSQRAPLPVEGMAPSVLLPSASQKPVSVFGFDACALQDLAALLEKPV